MSQTITSDNKAVFCLVPWTHLHIWPNGTAHLCCTSDSSKPIGHFQDSKSIKELWNTPRLKEIRLSMLKGELIPECSRCYEIEKSGTRSMRQDHNLTFSHHMEKVKTTAEDGTVQEVNMPYMDIRFSNICNFRCRTCGPELSSSWHKDAKALKWQTLHEKPLLHLTDDTEILWKQIEEILPTVELIYFAGGEPLIMEEHYRILNWLIKHKKFDVQLRYNTNFSITSFQGQSVFELWKKFNSVTVGASLDTSDSQAEYMRKETNWELITNNRKKMLDICPDVSFYVSVTLSIFSMWRMAEFHRNWVKQGLVKLNEWHINPLTNPLHYRVHVVPLHERQEVMRKYQDHIEWIKSCPDHYPITIERWRGAIAFLEGEQLIDQVPKFRKFTKELDELRGERISDVFPELSSLYNE